MNDSKLTEQMLRGGLGDGLADFLFDNEQLERGIEVEMKHTNDRDVAKKLAKDNLVLSPRYYDFYYFMITLISGDKEKRFG